MAVLPKCMSSSSCCVVDSHSVGRLISRATSPTVEPSRSVTRSNRTRGWPWDERGRRRPHVDNLGWTLTRIHPSNDRLTRFLPISFSLSAPPAPHNERSLHSVVSKSKCLFIQCATAVVNNVDKKAVLSQGNRAMPMLFFFSLKFADNIRYKFKSSQASKARLQSSKHTGAEQNLTQNGHFRYPTPCVFSS